MKTLQEYLTEARWNNAGGSIKHKLAPVMNEIWSKGDMSKFAAAFGKLLYDITGTQGIGIESDNEWMECEEGGKKAFGKVWRVVYYNGEDIDTIAKYFEKTFSIKRLNTWASSFDYATPFEIAKKIGVSIPKEIHTSLCMTDNGITIYTAIYIDEIRDKWEKYNPTHSIDFEFFGTPGGTNDCAGRTLMEGDVVAFMRRAGTGGMEIGTIIGVKKRPVIYTRDGNQVSLDGTQVCLVKRGNNVVS